jgi:hypothetical protein
MKVWPVAPTPRTLNATAASTQHLPAQGWSASTHPVTADPQCEASTRARREILAVLGRDESWLAAAAADRSWMQVLDPASAPAQATEVAASSPTRLFHLPDAESPAASPDLSAGVGSFPARLSIFPRSKSAFKGSSCKVRAARVDKHPVQIDLDALKRYADQPQHLAASYLNVSLSALKSICRRMGFSTWYEVRAATRTSKGAPQAADGASGM